jgi:hypothetical protein
MSSSKNRYCIIGGGPAGLAVAKCFKQNDIPFDLYESADDFGGTWYFGSSASQVYQSAHLISSKSNTQFSDFPMPADYPAYPSHSQFLTYLRNLARHFALYEHARFGATVEALVPDADRWNLRVQGSDEVHSYRGAIIANGRLRDPIIPSYPGEFSGEVLHSKHYQSPEIFRNKRVLIIGAGNSGCDIAVAAVPMAKRILFSTRRAYHYMPKFIDGRPTQEWLMDLPPRFKAIEDMWRYITDTFKLAGYDPTDYGLGKPDHTFDQAHPIMNSLILYHIGHGDVYPKPDVAKLCGDRVRFVDESEEEVDLVLYATGFRSAFPFLDKSIVGADPLADLYAHTLHRRSSTLALFGFINAASGFGNLANVGGGFLVDYIRAHERNSRGYQVLNQMKQGPEPDLGQGRFIKSERHRVEVDLWMYLRFLSALRAKLARA